MTLVVEDGTGLSTAESYLSVAAATTYWTARPTNTTLSAAWLAANTANKESALRVATQYLDANFIWAGIPATDDQALAWPRTGVYNSRGTELLEQVPAAVENACAELAARALSADLYPDTDRSNYTSKEKVGPIEVEYQPFAPTRTQYTFITKLLRDLIVGGGSSVELVRA